MNLNCHSELIRGLVKHLLCLLRVNEVRGHLGEKKEERKVGSRQNTGSPPI